MLPCMIREKETKRKERVRESEQASKRERESKRDRENKADMCVDEAGHQRLPHGSEGRRAANKFCHRRERKKARERGRRLAVFDELSPKTLSCLGDEIHRATAVLT